MKKIKIAVCIVLWIGACGLACTQLSRTRNEANDLAPLAGSSMEYGEARRDSPASYALTADAFAPGTMVAQLTSQMPAPTPNPSPAEPAVRLTRKVVYTAMLGLTVANRHTAHEAIAAIIRKYGGFIQRDTIESITFRVEPDRFESALREVESLGEVGLRTVESQDVTEAYVDLQLRIQTAEGSRKRLMDLLDRATRIEDVLKAEADIRRLTEEIETMKGKLRVLESQIELATITVALTQRQDQSQPRPRIAGNLFAWMNRVGIDRTLAAPPEDARIKGSRNPIVRWILGPRFRMEAGEGRLAPKGFVELLWNGRELNAVAAEDARVRAQLLSARQSASLETWGERLKEELASNRGYLVNKIEPAAIVAPDRKAIRLACRTTYGGEEWLYDVWIVQREKKPRELLVFEFVRRDTSKPAMLADVERAIAGVELRGRFLWM